MDQGPDHEWGEPCDRSELRLPRAVALLRALDRYPFAALLGVRRQGEYEGLLVESRVELPQRPPVPIRGREPVGVVVGPDENMPPRVFSLRRDFPDVLHLNLTLQGQPREFCLFDRPYRDVRSGITPPRLLDRVGAWLARAAVEELHLEDQPLEPMVLDAGRIIFEREVFGSPGAESLLGAELLSQQPLLLRMRRLPPEFDAQKAKGPTHLTLAVEAPPRNHRILGQVPQSLAQLAEALSGMSVDLEAEIRRLILSLADSPRLRGLGASLLVILLRVPMTRTVGGPVEEQEWWAFLVPTKLEELADRLGVMGATDTGLGRLLGVPRSRGLDEIPVAPLRPTFALSKPLARSLSGYSGGDPRVVAVGAGTLGSCVISLLARQGFGTWTIVDPDLLLPHNLARHALFWPHEGDNKAEALAWELRGLLRDEGVARALPVDVLDPRDRAAELAAALGECQLILDLSASRSVTRHLAYAVSPAVRICAYLGPSRRHLILLAEGGDRAVRLDDLELQLAAAAADPALHGVFLADPEQVRYSGSCREVSVRLTPDFAAVVSGVVAQAVKRHQGRPEPLIGVWEWSPEDCVLSRRRVEVHQVTVVDVQGWAVRLSAHAIALMRSVRRAKLPNETGGVLLGEIDHDRRVVYVVHALPSPADSVEWPTAYIRGAQGLRARVAEISLVTGGDLSYVGEWHSHPVGHDSRPSEVDLRALAFLAGEMEVEGDPALVAIQGDGPDPTILISSMG